MEAVLCLIIIVSLLQEKKKGPFYFRETSYVCSFYHCIQTSFGAHPASFPMGKMGCFTGGKAGYA